MAATVQCLVSGFELSMYMHIVHLWILLLTPECRVPESRWVGKLLTSIILLIGSNNAAARLTTINNIFIYCSPLNIVIDCNFANQFGQYFCIVHLTNNNNSREKKLLTLTIFGYVKVNLVSIDNPSGYQPSIDMVICICTVYKEAYLSLMI